MNAPRRGAPHGVRRRLGGVAVGARIAGGPCASRQGVRRRRGALRPEESARADRRHVPTSVNRRRRATASALRSRAPRRVPCSRAILARCGARTMADSPSRRCRPLERNSVPTARTRDPTRQGVDAMDTHRAPSLRATGRVRACAPCGSYSRGACGRPALRPRKTRAGRRNRVEPRFERRAHLVREGESAGFER